MTREVFCPTCKKKTLFSPENPFRPFCSERCRLIDLGDWASGKHAIPQQTNDEESEANLLSKTQDDAESDGE